MKHLKIFETAALFEAARATLDLPNVSLVEATMGVNYLPYTAPIAHDYSQDYFTLEFLESGTLKLQNTWDDDPEASCEACYSNGIFYSLDNGDNWIQYQRIENEWIYPTLNVSQGDTILLKSVRTLWATEDDAPYKIISTADFNASGNVMSLIWGDNFAGQTDFKNAYDVPQDEEESDCRGYNALSQLFEGNTTLINAGNLILPATELCEGWGMEYASMFNGCTSLITAPILPAETLSPYCYQNMFYGCTSLTAITCLATNISANNCTDSWVYGVAATGTFTKAASMTDWETGTSGIPSGWTTQNAE